MFSSKVVTVLGLVLAITAPAAFGSPLPADADGDPVLNNVEYWMQRNGATLDNNNAAILAWGANTYNDSDGDGIPDLVETYFTLTDPNVDDRVACGGGGSPNMSGQYEVRRAANLGAATNFLTDEFSAISVCHISGGVKVFSPRMGYATAATITGGGPYVIDALWSYRGVAVAFNGSCPAPCTDANIVVTGTLSIGGASAPASATRRATSAPSAASVNALYAVQEAHFPAQPGASADKLGDLGSRALQIDVNTPTQSKALVYTKDTYEAYPAYYSARTGTVFYTSFIYYADLYKEYDSLNSWDDSRRIALMVTEAPAAGVGGRIRGSDTELFSYPGNPMAVTEKQLYGKASLPNTGGVTLNRTTGIGTLLYLNNVPVSADVATVSGPAITTSTIWSDLDADYFNDRSFRVSYGVRLPGFTDGEKVGLATDGTSLDVSSIYHLIQGPLATGTYAFNFTGSVGGFGTVNVSHTNRSSTPLPVVTNVQLDGSPLMAGRQKSVTGVIMTGSHDLSWSPVSTGGLNGNGAGLYRVTITDPFDGRVSAPASITDPTPDAVSFFVDPAVDCPSDCSVTIPGNTLADATAYRIEIEAVDKDDPNNRSLTDRYYINTKPFVPSDFNLDHTNDLLWRRASDGAVVQWLMAFGSYSSTHIGGGTNWTVINTAGDFNDDGRADILWRRSDGAIEQWLMSGSAQITATILGGDNDWSIVQVGDFNGDGKSDVIWRQASTGSTLMWLMDGSDVAKEVNLGGDTNWNVIQVGDFNGDGKSDLLWRRASDGAVVMWLMDGSSHSSAYMSGATSWNVIQVGDFNADGKSDLLWRRDSDGAVIQWLMDGFVRTGSTHLGGTTSWSVVKTGDFNSDGKSDILWRRLSDGAVVMWLMDGDAHTPVNLGGSSDWVLVP